MHCNQCLARAVCTRPRQQVISFVSLPQVIFAAGIFLIFIVAAHTFDASAFVVNTFAVIILYISFFSYNIFMTT